MQNGQHEVLALVSEVGAFLVMRLKTVIRNMPEFTLHDETHIFNMLIILGKIIPASTLENLSVPDLLMLVLSVLLHDIGMAPEEKYILANPIVCIKENVLTQKTNIKMSGCIRNEKNF